MLGIRFIDALRELFIRPKKNTICYLDLTWIHLTYCRSGTWVLGFFPLLFGRVFGVRYI